MCYEWQSGFSGNHSAVHILLPFYARGSKKILTFFDRTPPLINMGIFILSALESMCMLALQQKTSAALKRWYANYINFRRTEIVSFLQVPVDMHI